MKETIQKIALAGLMHDIGKIAQGCLEITPEYRINNADIYQPFKNGHHTHVHALYTAAFIEQNARVLPHKCNSRSWGNGDSFINLAACHHKPETPFQWIITMADRISSGLDRAVFENGQSISYKRYKATRLLPVLESLGPDRCDQFKSASKFLYEYSLDPLSANSIFPVRRKEISEKQALKEYDSLFQGFLKGLEQLLHIDNMELWIQHFDSLLMIYTSCVPAARVGDVVHDVSLYDHSHTTAALAAALYQYHKTTETLTEKDIQDVRSEKFLLIGGDFYGIQDFIFSLPGETREFRTKLLRGRSFAVSLFSELAAYLICEKLNLPLTSILLNAAGKFHILAPNTEDVITKLKKSREEINDWLLGHTYGENSLGISWTMASPAQFHAGNFRFLWEKHLQNIEKSKYKKLDIEQVGGVISGYLDAFNNDIEPGKRLCPMCGKRPSTIRTKDDSVFGPKKMVSCDLCRDHVFLGKNLVSGKKLAICSIEIDCAREQKLLEPIFGKYQVIFTNEPENKLAEQGKLLGLWQMTIDKDGSISPGATIKLINGHVPRFRPEDNFDDCLLEGEKGANKKEEMIEQIREEAIKTFNHIALKARRMITQNGKVSCQGLEAIGVLKADVDNLGMLLGCGLSDDRFTISRLATMSRQLNAFFSLYLVHVLETEDEYYDVYTVFAGGDDLFLIGPWNRMASLAAFIQRKFAEYTCQNSEITISAGLSIHKPNTPIDAVAEASEEALKDAKRAGRNRVTMFGRTVTWEDFHDLLSLRKQMEGWLKKGYISSVMFYRFNYLIDMAEKEYYLTKGQRISVEELDCVKWPAMFRYGLARNITNKRELREAALQDVGRASEWIKKYRGALRIPLWHVLYEKRA